MTEDPFGLLMKEGRKRKRLSQVALGRALDPPVGGDQISEYERGLHRPYGRRLEQIIAVLGLAEAKARKAADQPASTSKAAQATSEPAAERVGRVASEAPKRSRPSGKADPAADSPEARGPQSEGKRRSA